MKGVRNQASYGLLSIHDASIAAPPKWQRVSGLRGRGRFLRGRRWRIRRLRRPESLRCRHHLPVSKCQYIKQNQRAQIRHYAQQRQPRRKTRFLQDEPARHHHNGYSHQNHEREYGQHGHHNVPHGFRVRGILQNQSYGFHKKLSRLGKQSLSQGKAKLRKLQWKSGMKAKIFSNLLDSRRGCPEYLTGPGHASNQSLPADKHRPAPEANP